MKATILIDNITKDDLLAEWGLSIYIEYGGKKILLDAGASPAFLENAEKLGISMEQVDFAVLSHAHYDHSYGMEAFFEKNRTAPFYLQACCKENCYSEHEDGLEYVGLPKGILTNYADRLYKVDGAAQLMEGVELLPHTTPNLEEIGRKIGMFTMEEDGTMKVEDFAHEESLVFRTKSGLVIFNCCCHGGADNIIREVEQAYPGEKIYAIIGGFHLYKSTEAEVRAFGERVKETGIELVVTGHCTGEEGFEVLKDVLGNTVKQIYSGFSFEIA